jgi:hypothetical protein
MHDLLPEDAIKRIAVSVTNKGLPPEWFATLRRDLSNACALCLVQPMMFSDICRFGSVVAK